LFFPTPLTPETNVALIFSFFLKKELFSRGFIKETIYSFKIVLISSAMSFFGSILLSEIISFISEAATTPTSD
jgi:hypothetical protein